MAVTDTAGQELSVRCAIEGCTFTAEPDGAGDVTEMVVYVDHGAHLLPTHIAVCRPHREAVQSVTKRVVAASRRTTVPKGWKHDPDRWWDHVRRCSSCIFSYAPPAVGS